MLVADLFERMYEKILLNLYDICFDFLSFDKFELDQDYSLLMLESFGGYISQR